MLPTTKINIELVIQKTDRDGNGQGPFQLKFHSLDHEWEKYAANQ